MNLRRLFTVIAVSVAMGACASTEPSLKEVEVTPARRTLSGYSFVPPSEQGWRVLARRPEALVLRKQGANRDESYYLQSNVSELRSVTTSRDLALLVRDAQVRQAEPARFFVTIHDVDPYLKRRTPCVQSHWVAEDHGAVSHSTRAGHMILEAWSLTCVHPDNERVGVNLEFSKRYYPGDNDADLFDKAAGVFESLVFTKL